MQLAIDIALSLIYFAIFLIFCAWSWRFWKMYVNQKHLNNIDWLMLEIKLPREIMKSPLATEVAISSLLQGGGLGTKYDRNYRGNLPVYSSLEIASIEGVLHFYVRIQKRFRSLVESSFYAQYPGIEILEADDYTSRIRYHHLTKDVSMWGARYSLTQSWTPIDVSTGEALKKEGEEYKMKADFLPIKTYIDYGLDKNPDEEYIIDPMAPMLEFMGSIGKGENFWFQIILQDESVYNKKMPKFYVNKVTHEHLSLKDMADARRMQIRGGKFRPKGSKAVDEYGEVRQRRVEKDDGKFEMVDVIYKEGKWDFKQDAALSLEEKQDIEAINFKFSRPLAVCVVRMLYVAEKSAFRPENIQNILAFPKPFIGRNSLAPEKTSDPYAYPWQNYQGRRVPWRSEEMFEEYVEREGFYPHIPDREWLTKWEDNIFWSSSMKTRKLFRMFYESFFHPFDHPYPEDAITLNLAEIATMWHLPSAAITTPTLPRIDSSKGVAPVNLPQ